jgi:hypothetical protein
MWINSDNGNEERYDQVERDLNNKLEGPKSPVLNNKYSVCWSNVL